MPVQQQAPDRIETDAVTLVRLIGEHDHGDYQRLRKALFAPTSTLVCDLSEATFIDYTVCDLIYATWLRLDGRVAVVVPPDGTSDPVRELIERAGLRDWVPVERSYDAALIALDGSQGNGLH